MESAQEKSLVKAYDIHGSPSASDQPLPPSSYLSPIQNVKYSSEIVEESSGQRSEHLISDMTKQPEDFLGISILPPVSPTPKRVNFSPLPSPSNLKFIESPNYSSTRGKSPIKALIPKLSFKFRNPNAVTLGSSPGSREKPSMTRSFSLSKLFTHRIKRTSSLPATPVIQSSPESTHGGNAHLVDLTSLPKGVMYYPMHRSRSVPALKKDGSVRQNDYVNGVIRVIPTTPRVAQHNPPTSDANTAVDIALIGLGVEDPVSVKAGRLLLICGPRKCCSGDGIPNHGEDIPQEEAVCRICLVELSEGSDTLKMECKCKGELALAHQDCAVKWFSIKGNRTCDICKEDVQNLPVTLLRLPSGQPPGIGGQPGEITQYRVWQDVPVLVIVSMLAYFCFLEQLLVAKMGSGAIAISLPFSCISGLLASMTSTTMVRRKYAWVYATIQFALVVLSAHIFYSLAVLSVLLATFAGFGSAMCGTSILFELLKWRRSLHALSTQTNISQEATIPDHSSDNNQTRQTDPEQPRNATGSPGIGRVI